jgi:predicted ribonuclease YlaK
VKNLSKCVADTSALLTSIDFFERYSVIIVPYGVVRELDRHKTRKDDKGYNARNVIRAIMSDDRFNIFEEMKGIEVDDEVIRVGVLTKNEVVTSDYALFIKARANNIPAIIIEQGDEVEDDCCFEAYTETIDSSMANEYLIENGSYGIVHSDSDRLVRYVDGQYRFITHKTLSPGFGKVDARNKCQTFLQDAIMDDSIRLVAATGISGSGKTFIALATAMHLIEKGKYDSLIVTAPPVEVGSVQAYGYAPGTLTEKASNYMMGIIDNLRQLRKDLHIPNAEDAQAVIEYLQIQPFTIVRGRNIDKAILVIDEAQNAHVDELKAMLTRVTDNCKVILLGDVKQSDLHENSNGLSKVIEAFSGQSLFAKIKMQSTQRGKLCDLAYRLL